MFCSKIQEVSDTLCRDFLRSLVEKPDGGGWWITVVVYDSADVNKYIGNSFICSAIHGTILSLMSSMETHFN